MFSQPLILGSTYRLKFKSAFERHGVCTTPGVTCLHPGGGVFRLEQITNFRDVVLAGIKLYDVFFKPLGFTEEEYSKYFDGKPEDVFEPEYTTKMVDNETTDTETQTVNGKLMVVTKKVVTSHEVHVETSKSRIKKHYKDNVNYASYPVYKFVDVIDTSDVIYVPELTIAEFPEIDINEYKDLSLVIHLGYLDDPAKIDPMLLSIRERMAAYGWRPSLVRLYCTDTKWMSPMEYEAAKNMRVPASLVMINDSNRAQYLGETAIINGQFKKIAEHVTAATADSEVDIDAIKVHPKVIDNGLFIVPCTDSDTFVAGDTYYMQVIKEVEGQKVSILKILKEGYDFSPGDPCAAYAPVTAAEIQEHGYTDLFTKNDPSYTAVEYGKHGEYTASSLLKKIYGDVYVETTDAERVDGKTYWIYEGELSYRVATDEDFLMNDDAEAPALKKFKPSMMYMEKQTDRGEIYRAATEDEIADPSQVLYFKNPDTYTAVTINPSDFDQKKQYFIRVVGNDGKGVNLYKEMYSTVEALELQGFKFTYQDLFKYTQNLTLQLEDIIDIGTSENNVTLPDQEYDPYWKEYEGRRFRWQVPSENPTQTVTLELTISDKTYKLVAGKTGSLLGQSGQIGKEIYVKDSNSLRRNYYMQYMTQLKTVEDQKARIEALENLVLELVNKQASS